MLYQGNGLISMLHILHKAVTLDSASLILSLSAADVRRALSHSKRKTA